MADDEVPGVEDKSEMTPKPRKPTTRKKTTPKPAAKTTAKRKPAEKSVATKPKRSTNAKPKSTGAANAEGTAKVKASSAADAATPGEPREKWRGYADQAKEKASEFAKLSKDRSTEGLGTLGRSVGESGSVLDEKVGVQYGDYMRTIGKSIEDLAGQIDEKSVEQLMDETREFVRKSPAMVIGAAAVAGFMLSRVFKGGNDS